MDIAKFIYDHWLELRADGRFNDVLPSARSFRKLNNGKPWGYETHEHQIRRGVSIPGSGPTGGDGVAGLIETYFSERLDEGALGWGLNFHLHIVEVENEPLRVAHLAQLVRNVAALRRGLCGLKVWDDINVAQHGVYVHGALLGQVVSGDVVVASAMLREEFPQLLPRISLGCVNAHPSRGILVKRVDPRGNYRNYSYMSEDLCEAEQRALGELLGPTPMWSEWARARRAEQDARYEALNAGRPCPRCQDGEHPDTDEEDEEGEVVH